MENFLFSINSTVPIFLVMVVGWALHINGILTDEFVKAANKFNFNVTLPVLLFRDISSVDIRAVFDLEYVLFCALSSSLCFWLIWGGARLFLKDGSLRGAFVQASFRSSAAIMGMAFIQNLYGSSAMGPLMIIGAVPLYNIYSVICLTFEAEGISGEQNKVRIRKAVFNIFKNPIIIAIALGLVSGLLCIEYPVIVNKTVDSVAQLATPLALIALGAGFEGRKALAKIRPTIAASLIKLVIQPALILPAAYLFGFTGDKIIAALVMLAGPATPTCYIMAKNMKNDGVLTASIIVMTTLLSAFTLTGWIFMLKTAGWI